MPDQSAPWLRWLVGMGERRKLGDVAMDVLLFAGMVREPPFPTLRAYGLLLKSPPLR